MVSRNTGIWRLDGLGMQLLLATVVAVLILAWQSTRVSGFTDLWLTADQQAMLAFDDRDWVRAVEAFDDPGWKGVAAYRGGKYEVAAQAFGRIASAEGYFNRGDALMKGREYRNAVKAFELAVQAAPDWTEAQENLEVAKYTVAYIERTREQSDTGEQPDLGADDYAFDNEEDRGSEVEISRESTVELQSAEKWMRSVDTETSDFLRTRFQLEASRAQP
jgi:Ca-activated chloride channel family protein